MTAPTNVTFTTGTTITSEWLNGVNDYVNELDPADHSAANVTYDPPFTNSVATTVEDKLAQYVSVKDFGAVGDGVTDDTIAIQNAIDACIANNQSLYFPRGETGLGLYLITSALTISASISISGSGYNYSGLKCAGCDGFIINAGVTFVTIENMTIAQTVRYSTTPNLYAAIKINGASGHANFWNTFRNLFIDGFGYVVNGSYFWSTLFNNVVSAYCGNGIVSSGQSVNNFVTNCSLGGSSGAGTVGIYIDGDNVGTEGWVIANNLIAYFGSAISSVFCGNTIVSGNILDFCQERGIAILDNSNGASINWNVTDNYIATDNVSGLTGIYTRNDFTAGEFQNRGHSITNNNILQYSGANWSYGIIIDGAAETYSNISGNRVYATTYACFIEQDVTNVSITNNKWINGSFYNNTTNPVIYANNIGTISSSVLYLSQNNGKTSFYHGTTAPIAGTYVIGDIVWNDAPASGGYVGWVCTSGGTPGTWKTFGAIS